MEIVELPGHLGVEVRDVDLRGSSGRFRGWTVEDVDRLRAEWDRRHLLLVRGQELSGEDQVAFVTRFGPMVPEKALWAYVSNIRPDGIVREGALPFHSDFAFAREATLGISLHALAMPPDGAPTLFANAVRAARLLPPALRRRLEGRTVVNLFDFQLPSDHLMREGEVSPGSPRAEHPVLGIHPRTGVEVVMANHMHSDRIVGLPGPESRALLDELFAVLYDDGNVVEHRWEVGDLVLWDNIALHHGRRAIPLDQPRTLQRVTLGRYTPSELVPDLERLLAPTRHEPAPADPA